MRCQSPNEDPRRWRVIAKDCLVCETCEMPRAHICNSRAPRPPPPPPQGADNGYIVSYSAAMDILLTRDASPPSIRFIDVSPDLNALEFIQVSPATPAGERTIYSDVEFRKFRIFRGIQILYGVIYGSTYRRSDIRNVHFVIFPVSVVSRDKARCEILQFKLPALDDSMRLIITTNLKII